MIYQSNNKDTKWKKVLIVGIAAVVLLGAGACILASADKNNENSPLRVSVIDVGKGDCILVQCLGSNILIDAGYEDTAEDVVKYLKDSGVDALSMLIMTHYHKDHVGGAAKIVESFSVDHVYIPNYEGSSDQYRAFIAALRAKGADTDNGIQFAPPYVIKVDKDQTIGIGGPGSQLQAQLTIYASDIDFDEKKNNHNDCSLAASLSFGKDSYLFGADLEKEGIEAFLAEHSADCDVLKVPHHGNRTKGMEEFLKAASPKIAVMTDSDGDQAQQENLSILEGLGSRIYRSSANGTIVITSSGTGEYKVSTGL